MSLIHKPRLLFRPKIQPEESLAGYLLRVVELNCLGGVPELLVELGQKKGRTYAPSQLAQFFINDLEAMAINLGHPVSMFQPHCRPRNTFNGWRVSATSCGLKWPLDIFRHTYRAWCPECLRNFGIQFDQWDYKFVVACPIHNCMLIERCPECQQLVKWRFSRLSHCACGGDLRRTKVIPAKSEHLVETSGCADRMLRVTLLLLLDDVKTVGELNVTGFKSYSLDFVAEKIPQYIDAIIDVTHFEETVKKILNDRYRRFSSLGPRFIVCPLLLGLGINEAFDDLLVSIALGWMNSNPSREIFDAEYGNISIGTREIQAVLNISNHVVGQLFNSGILSIEKSIKHPTGVGREFHLRTLCKFLKTLQVMENSSKQAGRIIHYTQFGMEFEPKVDFLVRLSKNEVSVVDFNPCIGIPSLILAVPIVKKETDERLSVVEIGKRLNIYSDAVYRVVHAGLLKHVRIECRQIRVELDDFITFNQEYVFVRELASLENCNPTNLADKLKSAGVQPVHGPSVDGGLVYLFRRKDLENLNLHEIASKKIYASSAGRRRSLV